MNEQPVPAVGAFVTALAQAWKRLRLYPEGHPARQGSVARVHATLRALIAPTGRLTLGVARDGLIYGEDKLGSGGAESLAHSLYRLNVAVVHFDEGVTEEDLERLMTLLRTDRKVEDSEMTGGLAAVAFSGISIEAVDFSAVAATSDLTGGPRPDEEPGVPSLWDRILGLQLGAEFSPAPLPAGDGTLAETIHVIDRCLADVEPTTADGTVAPQIAQLSQLISGALDEHLSASVSEKAESALLTGQTAELIGALPSALRAPVLETSLKGLASSDEDSASLRALAVSMPAADLVASLRSMRDEGLAFSPAAIQLIDELWRAPSNESVGPTAKAGMALIEAMREDLDESTRGPRPSPVDDFVLQLPRLPAGVFVGPPEFEQLRESLVPTSVSLGLLNGLLELLGRESLSLPEAESVLARLEAVFGELVSGGYPQAGVALFLRLRDLVQRQPEAPLSRSIEELFDRLAGRETALLLAHALPRASDRERAQLESLVEVLGAKLSRNVLSALNDSEDRAERRLLFDFLRAFNTNVVPDVRAALKDSRWYVVRNMISLLTELEDRNAITDLRACVGHEDARVRQAAIRGLISLDRDFPVELIEQVLADPDVQLVQRSVHAFGVARLPQAVGPLLGLLTDRDPLGRKRSLRIQCLQSLGQIGDPSALPILKPFFGAWSLHSLEERRAAYDSLGGYPANERQVWLEKGLKARDDEIRTTCERLSRLP